VHNTPTSGQHHGRSTGPAGELLTWKRRLYIKGHRNSFRWQDLAAALQRQAREEKKLARTYLILGLLLLASLLVGCASSAATETQASTPVPTTALALPEELPGAATQDATATVPEPGAAPETEEQTPEPPRDPTEDLELTPMRPLPTDPKGRPVIGTLSPPPVLPAHTPGTQVDAVRQAMEDLARRLGVEPEQIQLAGVSPDEFPAGDLGCPAPGQTPVPNHGFVTGRSIVLEVDETRYLYRAHGGLVVFCGER
jgi:hypothetical protein